MEELSNPTFNKDYGCITPKKLMVRNLHTQLAGISLAKHTLSKPIGLIAHDWQVIWIYPVPKSYTQGYLYDFEEGASFKITSHAVWNGKVP
ncbi:MAG TPA: hypothetical protein VIL78_21950 [Hanamia sp.]